MAANRDEDLGRPWLPPGRHWPDAPDIVAGQDSLAGGTWLGMNDHGVVAGVMNRIGTLGPQPGKRSRGELVLQALRAPDAKAAGQVIAAADPTLYRPFNLVIADALEAHWFCWTQGSTKNHIESAPVPAGLSMFTDRDRNDPDSPRIKEYLPKFEQAAIPDPETLDGWTGWLQLLGARRYAAEAGPKGAMTIDEGRFGTLSSSLVALPAERAAMRPMFWFAGGPPDRTPYRPVAF